MEREIKVAGATFVVDDPKGMISAMGVYPMAWGMFHAPRAAIGITFAILTVIAHTAFFFSATVSMLARRAGK